MKLYFTPTSPYARKVRMVVSEKGLKDRIDLTVSDPFGEGETLNAANPLGKVPALVLDGGEVLFDSPVICAYLDTLSDVNPLIPADPTRRWGVLTAAALADGMLDAAFALVMERRRPQAQQSPLWQDRWSDAIQRSVGALDADIAVVSGDLSLAQIGLGAALGYLDFRLAEMDWRKDHPDISHWFAAFSERPSMQLTHPKT